MSGLTRQAWCRSIRSRRRLGLRMVEASSSAPRSGAYSLPRREGYGFDLVAVGVADESSVIVGVVVFPDARRSFVSPAICQSAGVKPPYGFPVGRLKGDVD